tara:strand:+ start:165 stop:347 length:183 start_codon:yes stop_codon:yes gene_type:complete
MREIQTLERNFPSVEEAIKDLVLFENNFNSINNSHPITFKSCVSVGDLGCDLKVTMYDKR